MTIQNTLTELLRDAFQPMLLQVENESAKHAGHAGHIEAGGGSETHFNVTVVSAMFEGQGRMARQRSVNALATPLFEQGLHALALKTLTPEEWKLRGE